jgi:hypothetical protein
VATFVSACSQGQHTHSARTKMPFIVATYVYACSPRAAHALRSDQCVQQGDMHLMPDLRNYPSNFELIHLSYDYMMDDEILWLVSQYCAYVYGQKKQKAHNYIINVDKLRSHLMGLYANNQNNQNVLAYITF